MNKIVIIAVTALAVVSAVNAATDIVAATEIGYPPYVKRQCDDAKGINCLRAWNDKIYIGYGSWSPNRGPVCINYYSPDVGEFMTDTVYIDDQNQNQVFLLEDSINDYVVIGNKLYVTGTDPMPYPGETPDQSWQWGDFYRNDGSGWVKHRTIPNGVHNFDINKFGGDFFVAIGIANTGVPLLRSENKGLTWVDAIGSSGIKRFNHLFKIGGALYAIASKGDPGKVYKYDSSAQLFAEASWDLMPGKTKAVTCVAVTDERIYYIEKGNDHAYTALPEEDGIELPKHNPDEKIWDFKINDNLLYVLTTVENEDDFTIVVCTVDGKAYRSSVSTVLPSNAISMEVLDGTIYLGTESGIIYSIPDNT